MRRCAQDRCVNFVYLLQALDWAYGLLCMGSCREALCKCQVVCFKLIYENLLPLGEESDFPMALFNGAWEILAHSVTGFCISTAIYKWVINRWGAADTSYCWKEGFLGFVCSKIWKNGVCTGLGELCRLSPPCLMECEHSCYRLGRSTSESWVAYCLHLILFSCISLADLVETLRWERTHPCVSDNWNKPLPINVQKPSQCLV